MAEVSEDSRFRVGRGDICDPTAVFEAIGPRAAAIVDFATLTHVDRSILEPGQVIKTYVLGTHVLQEAVRVQKRLGVPSSVDR